ncbi:MAG: DUF1848 domain-containing protein [Coriobacteriales bacterium]|jgi:DNA repair photolyase
MIISASRRTDIPAFYSDWFLGRIHDGEVMVRNPVRSDQVSRIRLSPDVVDCIVFWTKNPAPMLKRLGELDDYMFYFLFTLNPYENDIERNLPTKNERIETFRELSEAIGKERVVWRYDPILISENCDVEWHLDRFAELASELRSWTERCIISFLDVYRSIARNLSEAGIRKPDDDEILKIARGFSSIASKCGISVSTCAEERDLSEFGIGHASCIDGSLIEKLTGYPLDVSKDRNQRECCGCVESIDIGSYETCPHGCVYCYANHSETKLERNLAAYDPTSPLLCDLLHEGDVVKDREVRSLKSNQLKLPLDG